MAAKRKPRAAAKPAPKAPAKNAPKLAATPKPKAKPAAAKAPAAKRPPRAGDTITVKAVRAELRDLEQRKTGIKASAHAALAVAMAKRIDDPDTSASAAASCGRVLNDAMNELRAQAPEKPDTKDGLDRILDAAAERRAAT